MKLISVYTATLCSVLREAGWTNAYRLDLDEGFSVSSRFFFHRLCSYRKLF